MSKGESLYTLIEDIRLNWYTIKNKKQYFSEKNYPDIRICENKNKKYKYTDGFLVFGSSEYKESVEDCIKNESANTLKPEHRYYAYYNLSQKPQDEKNLITFILFNPSTTNEERLDPTVHNCLKIAQNSEYDAVEILNLYSFRSPKVCKNKLINNNNVNEEFLEKIIENRSVLVKAWGWGKEEKDYYKSLIKKISEKLKDKKVLKLKVKDTKTVLENLEKNLHPATSIWNLLGGIENAELG